MAPEDAKPSKKSHKKKPNTATSKYLSPKKVDVKKEEADDDFEELTTRKSSDKTVKVQKKKKKKKKKKKEEEEEEEEKKKGIKETQKDGKKKEKKVYDLPGQKGDPPDERDPLRIFYETLYKQLPNSELAAFWMMESGLLPKEAAKNVYEKKLKRSQQQKLSSPTKAVVTVKKTAESVTVERKTMSSQVAAKEKKTPDSKAASKQSKKRKIEDGMSDDGSDDDFVLADRKIKKQRAA